jgi:anaerobic selenocysteine-containing dehydrogenase
MTPSGKFEFLEEWEPEEGSEVDERYPLRLLSLKYQRYQSSQVLESQQKESECTAWVHPDTATRFGFGEGAKGRLLSPSGECEVLFALDKGLREDVCLVRSGGWVKKGHGVNVLTEDVLTNSGECSGYYETRVRPVLKD